MDDGIYERSVELLEADLQGEMVALDPHAGLCFGFNEVATSVWRLLERPRSGTELRARLLDEYDVADDQCRDELEAFLGDLVQRGLIRTRGRLAST